MQINIGTANKPCIIDLPDLLISRLLIQANSGGGKTVIGRNIIEETFGLAPFIALDDAGEYYPLKEKYGDVIIMGGEHADVPLTEKSVKLLPKFIIGNQLSVVFDLSQWDSMKPRISFVKHFLEALMGLPQQYWMPYLIFLEEAHKYCGQQDKQDSAEAVKELLSGGRKKGYCAILITQRISKLHKDLASECNNKFVGRTVLDIDMDRAAKELGFTANSEFTRLSLRELQPGEFYAYGTSIEPHHVHKVAIKMPQTKIIKFGQIVEIKPKKPTAKLLQALAKLNELPQEAAKELKTIQALEAEIARLKKELHKKPAGKEIPPKHDQSEKNNALQQENKRLQTLIAAGNSAFKVHKQDSLRIKKTLESIIRLASDNIPDMLAAFPKLDEKERLQHIVAKPLPVRPPMQPPSLSIPAIIPTNGRLPKGERKILIALSQYENGLKRKQITVLTGYTRRTRDSYIQFLSLKGLAEVDGDRIFISSAGQAELGSDYKPLPKGEELREYWMKELPKGEAAILEVLIAEHPQSVSRDEITDRTGYTRRTRDSYLQFMVAKEIIETTGQGQVKASDYLFD